MDKIDLDSVFNSIVERRKYYHQIKKAHISYQDENSVEKKAFVEFHNEARKGIEPIKPKFITFYKNLLYLPQQTITIEMSQALAKFL